MSIVSQGVSVTKISKKDITCFYFHLANYYQSFLMKMIRPITEPEQTSKRRQSLCGN